MDKLHELAMIHVEASNCVTNFSSVVRGRSGDVSRRVATDAISQRPTAPLSASMVEEGVASDPEEPHACLFRLAR